MNQNKMLQSGRSMVEMLGVLAIVGVLSIGGIAGYSYGMDKYRANETINDVNLRGIDLVRQVATNKELSLADWPTTSKSGYTISDPVLSAEGDAYFSISGVPQRVCEMVYAGIQNNQTTDVEVNGYVAEDSSACDKAEDNKMGFFFITNAGEGGIDPEELCKDVTCPEGSSCTHGICMSEEIPQLQSEWFFCQDDQCGECKKCRGSHSACNLEDGTPCRNTPNGVCINGMCVDNTICTDNSDCSNGYYCGKTNNSNEQKTCIKADFFKITLHTGEVIYMSKQGHVREEGYAICESIGMEFIYSYEDRMDVVGKLYGLVTLSANFQSASQRCEISEENYSFNRAILDCRGDNYHSGLIVCVKENKVYDGDVVWGEPETVTETVTEISTIPPLCNSNQYLADTNESCYNANPSNVCKDLDFRTENINGTTYYISNNTMSWWDAVSACEALGNKQLLSVEDMIILFDDDVIESLSNPGEDTISYASHPGHELTELGKALYSKGWNNTGLADVWSNVLLEYNSCYAYPVALSSGIVSGYGGVRNENRQYAICR